MRENERVVNLKLDRMLLAGDIGGTKTRLGLFDPVPARPRLLSIRTFTTLDFADLPSMIAAFLAHESHAPTAIASASFGVAGPVINDVAELTNVPWRVEARRVAAALGPATRVRLLNDLEAMAYAVPVLNESEVYTLQEGEALEGGNIALIAAGTGLGVALLHHVDGRFVPSPSEGGHADFAARTEDDIALLRDLTTRFGRAEVEQVLSGRGLVNIHRIAHQQSCAAAIDLDDIDAPAAISSAALEGRCHGCTKALELFVDAYGAEAGNVALRFAATGGVYIGGGIAPKILPAFTAGRFMTAFRAKAPLEPLLEKMPVKIILNADSGLLGAAVFGAGER